MAYDFSNIRSIRKNDGTELLKITDSDGNIIWQKMYVWEKFNCNQIVSGYKYSRSSTTLSFPTSGDMYTGITFNSSNGTFTLTGGTGTIGGMNYWQAINGGLSGGVFEVWPYSDGYKYFKSGNNYYCLREAIPYPRPSDKTAKVYKYNVSENYTYTQGATSYGYVYSTSLTDYPENGRYSADGYWYILRG